jgi:hypothetical protein
METGPEDRLKGQSSLSTNPGTVPEGSGGWTRGQVKRDSLHYLQTLTLCDTVPEGNGGWTRGQVKGTVFIIYKP